MIVLILAQVSSYFLLEKANFSQVVEKHLLKFIETPDCYSRPIFLWAKRQSLTYAHRLLRGIDNERPNCRKDSVEKMLGSFPSRGVLKEQDLEREAGLPRTIPISPRGPG